MRKLYATMLFCLTLPFAVNAQTKYAKQVIYYVEDSTADISLWVDEPDVVRDNSALKTLDNDSLDFVLVDGVLVRPDRSRIKALAVPGYTRSELYSKAMDGIKKVYGDVDGVVKTGDNESITISSTASNMAKISISKRVSGIPVDGSYNFKLQFKDGEILVEDPAITSVRSKMMNFEKAQVSIDVKELALLDPKGVQGFPQYINDKIETILKASFTSSKK
ncbi:MAG: hypothetical protein K6E54_09095 [Bacteroidaceae bacterium]|nr:hypothetical protein [Bacteroidaceae bacterium]